MAPSISQQTQISETQAATVAAAVSEAIEGGDISNDLPLGIGDILVGMTEVNEEFDSTNANQVTQIKIFTDELPDPLLHISFSLTDDDSDAPPPLQTQMITAEVSNLRIEYIDVNGIVLNSDDNYTIDSLPASIKEFNNIALKYKINVVVQRYFPCEPNNHLIDVSHIQGAVSNLEPGKYHEINFKKWCIEWCDFLKIFYHCSNDFKVQKHLDCRFQKLIAFNNQLESEHCANADCFPFDLKKTVIDFWTTEIRNKMEGGENCEQIDRCSLMKLTKQLNKLRTIADMYKLCKLKVEAITRSDLVHEIVTAHGNPYDNFILNISVQISPEMPGLTPILLNFQYQVNFAWDPDPSLYYSKDEYGNIAIDYSKVICPKNCQCCKSKFLCEEDCECRPQPEQENQKK